MLARAERSRVDSRVTAMLRAKMRDGKGTREVRVGDISPTGLLVACDRPPARGEIVDIDVVGHHIIGEVRWVSGRRCGLRTRERINVSAILTGKPARKRSKGSSIDIEAQQDISKWPLRNLLIAYGVLGVTAFSTAYLIVNFLIL
ncbi:MAG: PilZ domain-containing protein [Erythrobacter sp.]|nr:MAG: PilZ domain-containing protein [Erythrobacter sp.]